jgi:hypothetical protein
MNRKRKQNMKESATGVGAVAFFVIIALFVKLAYIGNEITPESNWIQRQLLGATEEYKSPLELEVQALTDTISQQETEKAILNDAVGQKLSEIERLEQEKRLASATKSQVVTAINKSLRGKMAGKGNSIFMAAKSQEPELSAILLTAIMIHECGHNFDSYNVRVNNNISGMNWTADSRYRKNGWYVQYDNLEQSIWDMAERLSKNYIALGLVTIEQIGAKYAPVSDPRNGMYGMDNRIWPVNVSAIYNRIVAEVGA